MRSKSKVRSKCLRERSTTGRQRLLEQDWLIRFPVQGQWSMRAMKSLKFTVQLTLLIWNLSAFATQKALMIIDMQNEAANSQASSPIKIENDRKFRALLDAQLQIIKLAKANRLPVMVVELVDGNPNDYVATNSELLNELADYQDKTVTLSKRAAGLFTWYNPSKQEALTILKNWKVTDLVIIGINGLTCVSRTIDGALSLGFKVWTIPEGIGDFDSQEEAIYPFSFQKFPTKRFFMRGLIEVKELQDAFLNP